MSTQILNKITTESRVIISSSKYPHRWFCDCSDGWSCLTEITGAILSDKEKEQIAKNGFVTRPLN